MPIVECGATFRRPVFADDDLVIVSNATRVETRTFTMEHSVERGGEPVASGFERRVVARMLPTGRLEVTRMPDDLRTWLMEDATA